MVFQDYWRFLSAAAITHGAGVIKLFFDEVENERKTYALHRKNQSLLVRLLDRALSVRRSPASNVATPLGALEERGDTPPASATAVRKEDRPDSAPATEPVTVIPEDSADIQGETAPPATIETPPPAISDPPPTNAPYPGFGGGGGTAAAASEPADETAPAIPVIASPSDFSQTFTSATLSFSGTAEAGATVSMAWSVGGATSTAAATASGGSWGFADKTFDQGTTAVSFTATDAAGNVSEAAWVTLTVDSDAPSIDSFLVAECQFSISVSGCLTTATSLSLSWESSASDVAEYRVVVDGVATTTTTATSTTLSGFADGVYSLALVAADAAGNTATSSDETVEISSKPVLINEIAWMGSSASTSDEWIELWNTTSRSIDLSSFTLYAGDGTLYIPLSGVVAPGSYYLIERDDDTAVSDVAADLVSPFAGSSDVNVGLADGGEDLYLARFAGGATTTMDSVLQCGGNWCAGTSNGWKTMERYGDTVASALAGSWMTSLGEFVTNGLTASGGSIAGTPGRKNSASYLLNPNHSLSGDKRVTASSSPYLVARNGFTVAAGARLTLEEGVVVKVVNPNEPSISVNGTLIANGSTSSPVVITAFSDDEYGGDMNADGSATSPSPGYWMRLVFGSASADSSLTNAIIRYGGRWFSNTSEKTMVLVADSTVAFNTVTVENSDRHGLYLLNSTSTVANGVFRGNDEESDAAGVYVSGGSPTIADSTFSGNTYGLVAQNAPLLSVTGGTFTGNTTAAVDSSGALGTFRGNSGSGNGRNAVTIRGDVAAAGATTTLARNDLPYLLLGDADIPDGAALTFESGVVVKGFDATGGSGNAGRLRVESGGALLFSGTSSNDLVFTSVYDSSVGGATVAGSTAAAAGDWYGIEIASGGSLDLSGFTIRYAGGLSSLSGSSKGAIQLLSAGATSTIANALFEENYQHGIRAAGNNLSVSASTFRNHTASKVAPAAALLIDGATALLDSITFSNNELDLRGLNGPTVTCMACGTPTTSPENLLE